MLSVKFVPQKDLGSADSETIYMPIPMYTISLSGPFLRHILYVILLFVNLFNFIVKYVAILILNIFQFKILK